MKATMERGRDGEYGIYLIEGRTDGPVYVRDDEVERWLVWTKEHPTGVEFGNRHGLESDEIRAIAKVYEVADDQANREKAILAVGNVEGVAGVDDQMTVSVGAPAGQFYTVVKGDTLSKIAKARSTATPTIT